MNGKHRPQDAWEAYDKEYQVELAGDHVGGYNLS